MKRKKQITQKVSLHQEKIRVLTQSNIAMKTSIRGFIFSYTWLWLAILGFVLTRLYIFLNPPPYVRYFEEYANIWHYGLPPYLKHWFEYPPATIPFISGPLLLDLAGYGKYRLNFRIMMLLADIGLFSLVLATLKKLSTSTSVRVVSVLYYLVLTLKAKDFMYENLDTLFVICVFAPAVLPILFKQGWRWGQWLLYWLGTGLKLINAPLGLLYFLSGFKDRSQLFEPKQFIKHLAIPVIAALLIWAAPLLMYRSSLLVVWVYHKDRTLQVESIAAHLVRAANIFTKSETIYLSNYKSFDLKGPLSDWALLLTNLSFVVAMVIFCLYVLTMFFNDKNRAQASSPVFLLKATLVFVLSYLVTNKVFSTPYHLWYLALIAVYPYQSWRQRWFFFITSAIFLGVATTPFPQVMIGYTDLVTVVSVVTQPLASILLLVAAYGLKVPEYRPKS